jgi:rfaE bifunctional protein nucleotidyltransferase chain/domain
VLGIVAIRVSLGEVERVVRGHAVEVHRKLLTTEAVPGVIAAHRAAGRRVVFTNGCFDVLHRGHVEYLDAASRLGDVLIVGLNSDDSVRRLKGPDRPLNTAADRAVVLAGLASVDHVVEFGADTPAGLIELVRPDVYVKGGDYQLATLPEAAQIARLGGRVELIEFVPGRSTSALVERIRTVPDGGRRTGPGTP